MHEGLVEVLEVSKNTVRVRALAVVFCFRADKEGTLFTVSKEALGGKTRNQASLAIPLDIFVEARELAYNALAKSTLAKRENIIATQQEFSFGSKYRKKTRRTSKNIQNKPNRVHRKLSLTT